MKKLIICLTIATSLFISKIFAQETFESRAKKIAENIENITNQEKGLLKSEVEAINIQLDKKEITVEQAQSKKQQLSEICFARDSKVSWAKILLINKLEAIVKQMINFFMMIVFFD